MKIHGEFLLYVLAYSVLYLLAEENELHRATTSDDFENESACRVPYAREFAQG